MSPGGPSNERGCSGPAWRVRGLKSGCRSRRSSGISGRGGNLPSLIRGRRACSRGLIRSTSGRFGMSPGRAWSGARELDCDRPCASAWPRCSDDSRSESTLISMAVLSESLEESAWVLLSCFPSPFSTAEPASTILASSISPSSTSTFPDRSWFDFAELVMNN